MKKIVQRILKIFASLYLKNHKPEIIAITGSFGKTTAKKAVTILISKKFKTTNLTETSYNTEIGVPLFILGKKAPVNNLFWPITLIGCFFAVFSKKKIEKLVIEMGADKPKDISYLLSFIKPKISVITAVAKTHLQQFRTIENILKEKRKLIEVLSSDGVAILNYDDLRVRDLSQKTKAKVITYGLSSKADIYASDIKTTIYGTEFTLNASGKKTTLSVKSIGSYSLYPVLAATVCGLNYKFSLREIKESLSGFMPMKGRMNIISGRNNSFLIDDSYNANPISVLRALEVLKNIAPKKKIAVLGTMNELGDYYLEAHRKVGRKVASVADILVAVGDGGRVIADEANNSGMDSKNIIVKEKSGDAGKFLKNFVKSQDVILFKGSQNNVRMEKAVIEVMVDPEKAEELLVRQSAFWRKR